MDIEDPVETTIEDSDETTTHIKTDTIKLQKRFNKKNKYQRQPNRKWKILPKKIKHKLQKVDLDQLQDQREKKKIKNQLQIHPL